MVECFFLLNFNPPLRSIRGKTFSSFVIFVIPPAVEIKNINMKKIEHIGIAVKRLSDSIPLFEALLDTECYKTEKVLSENVETAFFKTGESKIELVAPAGTPNALDRFLEKRGEGIHHIAFQVDDLEEEIQRLEALGFQFISNLPKEGADDKMVCFLHPKGTNGVLVELVADK